MAWRLGTRCPRGSVGIPLETAARLKMHRDTVRGLLREGKLPGRRVGVRQWRVSTDALSKYTAGPVPEGQGEGPMPMNREGLRKWILDSRAEMTAALTRLLDTPGISIADRKRLALELKALERAKENDERLLGANKPHGETLARPSIGSRQMTRRQKSES